MTTKTLPNRQSINNLFTDINKIKVFLGGVDANLLPQGRFLFDLAEKHEFLELQKILLVEEVKDPGFCLCSGDMVFQLVPGNNHVSTEVITLHGEEIRWRGWNSDAPLSKPEKLFLWLSSHGFGELTNQRENEMESYKKYKELLNK